MLRVILLFILFVNISSQLEARDYRNNNVYLSPDELESSKHMRKEFVSPYSYLLDKKRLILDSKEHLSAAESHQRNITRLKDIIKKSEGFSDINDWENAQILSYKSRLAFLEKRYNDAQKLLIAIIESGHATQKTIAGHYYKLYQLMFKAKKYKTAEEMLSIAITKGHPYFPWDAANISEAAFRKQEYEKGTKLLTSSIDALKKNNCPVEDNWLNILQKITDDPTGDSITNLLSSTDPWFYAISLDGHLPRPAKARKEPRYPRKAAEGRMNGHITLSFIVNEQGSVVCSFLVEGVGKAFLKPSKKAVRKFKYHPTILNGKPSWIYGVGTRFTFQIG